MSENAVLQTCPNCGESYPPAQAHCRNCGVPNPTPEQVVKTDLGENATLRMLLPVGRSVWAIIAGYFGLFSVLLFPAPLALIFSLLAIRDIRLHKERHGMGRAVFGLLMGFVGTVALIALLTSLD